LDLRCPASCAAFWINEGDMLSTVVQEPQHKIGEEIMGFKEANPNRELRLRSK